MAPGLATRQLEELFGSDFADVDIPWIPTFSRAASVSRHADFLSSPSASTLCASGPCGRPRASRISKPVSLTQLPPTDPREVEAEKTLSEFATLERRRSVIVEDPTEPKCSEAEKKAAPKGYEDFGKYLCPEFKGDHTHVWPLQLEVTGAGSKHTNLLKVENGTLPFSLKGKFLLLVEEAPEARLVGEIPETKNDLCGCGPGHGWDTAEFRCSKQLEPSISFGFESFLCSKLGKGDPPVNAGNPFEAHPQDGNERAKAKAAKPDSNVAPPVFVRPMEVQIKKLDGDLKGNFLEVIPKTSLKGQRFVTIAAVHSGAFAQKA